MTIAKNFPPTLRAFLFLPYLQPHVRMGIITNGCRRTVTCMCVCVVSIGVKNGEIITASSTVPYCNEDSFSPFAIGIELIGSVDCISCFVSFHFGRDSDQTTARQRKQSIPCTPAKKAIPYPGRPGQQTNKQLPPLYSSVPPLVLCVHLPGRYRAFKKELQEELLNGEQPREVRCNFPYDAAETAPPAEAQHDRQDDVDGEEHAGNDWKRKDKKSTRALEWVCD